MLKNCRSPVLLTADFLVGVAMRLQTDLQTVPCAFIGTTVNPILDNKYERLTEENREIAGSRALRAEQTQQYTHTTS